MKWHRINALMMRHLYLYKRSFPRLMDLFFWPTMGLILWGFVSLYINQFNLATVNFVTILLGGVIFWELLSQGQHAVSIGFLEEVWEKNFLNIFVTPLKISEFLTSTALLGLVRIFLVGVIMSIISFIGYSFNIFSFGFYLIPLLLNLLLFGWILGIFTTAIILRYGTSAQVLAFGLIFIIQPFSAVFYPVSVLPHYLQYIAYILPSTYVFEGMRSVLTTGSLPWIFIWASLLLNLIYAALSLFFFYKTFSKVKEKGKLLKLD